MTPTSSAPPAAASAPPAKATSDSAPSTAARTSRTRSPASPAACDRQGRDNPTQPSPASNAAGDDSSTLDQRWRSNILIAVRTSFPKFRRRRPVPTTQWPRREQPRRRAPLTPQRLTGFQPVPRYRETSGQGAGIDSPERSRSTILRKTLSFRVDPE